MEQQKEMQKYNKNLGLYIHIPFCVKKCDYCDFLSGPATLSVKDDYFKALYNEIRSYAGRVDEYEVTTIFFGGGTPSSVNPVYIKETLDMIKEIFHLEVNAEISIEINPGTVEDHMLETYQSAGINRISFGLQSTDKAELAKLGRIHSYEEFLHNYQKARKLGFTNINVDLMSGLPKQTLDQWELTLNRIATLSPEHISAYSLIIEEGTPFYELYGVEGKEYLDEEVDRLIYQKTEEILRKYGYHRYEISNYAKEGFECRHNKIYWTGIEYLGLGLGSSSYVRGTRFHNEEGLEEYRQECKKFMYNHSLPTKETDDIRGKENVLQDVLGIRKDVTTLTEEDKMEEFMFLGLRLIQGIHKEQFNERFHKDYDSVYGNVTRELVKKQLLEVNDNWVRLTAYGIDISNQVLAEFLID